MNAFMTSRRNLIAGGAAAAAATGLSILPTTRVSATMATPTNRPIPELAPYWKKLDLGEILSRPAAFVSISQVKSLYEPWGVQGGEKQWERGTLEATVRVATSAREAGNFKSFNWIGYSVFRQEYPKSVFDEVQYDAWTGSLLDWPAEKRTADNELAEPLKALVQDGDLQYDEIALQSSFVGTPLLMELQRKRIETIVFTGIHLDWCIEGNARSARDYGFLPIVVGDACSCQKWEDDEAALRRINAFFAPVISSETFVSLLQNRA